MAVGVASDVVSDGREPRVVLSRFLATGAEDDRLSREPCHLAAELERGRDGGVPAEAAAIVAERRKRQDRLAVKGLDDHEPAWQGCFEAVGQFLDEEGI